MSIFVDFVCYGADGGEWREEMRDPRVCSAGTDGGMTHAASYLWGSASRQSTVRASKATRPTRQPTLNILAKKTGTHAKLFSFSNSFSFLARTRFTIFRLTLHPSQLAQKKNRNFLRHRYCKLRQAPSTAGSQTSPPSASLTQTCYVDPKLTKSQNPIGFFGIKMSAVAI